MSLEDTELWLRRKLKQLTRLWDAPEEDLPECDPHDLWQEDPKYKYYKDPDKVATAKRSNGTFDSQHEAELKYLKDGSVGTIITSPGKIRRCNPKFCEGYHLCTLKDQFAQQGLLQL